MLQHTLGQYKGRNCRSSHSRADGIALLGCVDSAVPAAPSFSGGKHATSATHLALGQGSLTSSYKHVYRGPHTCSDSVARQPYVPAYDSRHSVTGHRVRRKLHHQCKSIDSLFICLGTNSIRYRERRENLSFSWGKKDTFPKAPWPERWVPPPLTRGIRATALPVPQDSALVWWPEIKLSTKVRENR